MRQLVGEYDASMKSAEVLAPEALASDQYISCIEVMETVTDKVMHSSFSAKSAKRNVENLLHMTIPWMAYLVDHGMKSGGNISSAEASECIELTVQLLELCQIDDMAGQTLGDTFHPSGISRLQDAYGRSRGVDVPFIRGLSSDQCFKTDELATIFKHADMDVSIRNADVALKRLKGTIPDKGWKTVFIQEEFPSYESFIAFWHAIPRDDSMAGGYRMNCRIRLSDEVSVWGQVLSDGDRTGPSGYVGYDGEQYRLTPVSKGDMWRAVMQSGHMTRYQKSTFGDDMSSYAYALNSFGRSITDHGYDPDIVGSLAGYARFSESSPTDFFSEIVRNSAYVTDSVKLDILRKTDIMREHSKHRDDASGELLKRHEAVYRQIFEDPNLPDNPDIYFTRSGVSANGTAMLVARTLVHQPDRPVRACTVDGWYTLENSAPKAWETASPSDSDILLVGIEPNGPQAERGSRAFISYRDRQIRDFANAAAQHPERPYVLIADVTADVLSESLFTSVDIPANVTVIKTVSISKHQRGSRTHFFGSVAVFGNVSEDLVLQARRAISGETTREDVYVIPRLTRGELQQEKLRMQTLSRAFAAEFRKAQKHLKKEERWRFQKYSYFGFILPPESAIRDARKYRTKNPPFIGSENVKRAINDYLWDYQDAAVDKGDSYGLNQTRATLFGIEIPVKRNKKPVRAEIVRIGFGRKSTRKEISELARRIGEYVAPGSRE